MCSRPSALSQQARFGPFRWSGAPRSGGGVADSPPIGGTADAAGVAAGDDDLGGACPTGPDHLTRRGWHGDLRHCRHGRDQPAFCLQMGATVCAGRAGGVGRQIRTGSMARAASVSPDGAARRGRTPSGGLLTEGRTGVKESPVEVYKFNVVLLSVPSCPLRDSA
jgi:hypothetical protein